MVVVRKRIALVAALASVVAGLVLTVAPAQAATTILVPSHQPTIQAAIDAAVDGQTVVVAPGTYFENIDFKGKAIEIRSAEGPHSTIIDGRGISHVVVFSSGEARSSVLRGFTITHGAIPEEMHLNLISGAGIAIGKSSPTITGNIITGNHAEDGLGGGIGAAEGSPRIEDNYIHGNSTTADGGAGGIFAGHGAEIVMNVIEANTAGGGGGVIIYGGASVVRDNHIVSNHAGAHGGGGLRIDGPGGLYVGNTILNNTTDGAGGGARLEVATAGAPPYILNNTITGNRALSGSALAGETGGAVVVNNVATALPGTSVVWCSADAAAGLTFSHNNVYNGTASRYEGCADRTGTAGNISVDPEFDVGGVDQSYLPRSGSPVVDAGDTTTPSLPFRDHFGDPRVTDGNGDGVAAVDMGAVELPAVPVTGVRYHPLTPARILDTRSGAALGPASTLSLQVTGQGGVPASGVAAVVLNVTITEPTSPSWLTAWPAGVTRPNASNLNFTAGQTVPNLVVVKVGEGGKVNLYNSAGTTHVVADVAGWYGSPSEGSRYFGVTPARILDTRTGAKVGPASTLALQVTGQGGVPASGVSAVVLNVTAAEPTAAGWLTAWPAGVARPMASNLNFVAGQTVPNLVVVKVGEGGKVNLYNHAGSTHVVADVAGWFGVDGGPGGAGLATTTPARILDTRAGTGTPAGKVGAGSSISLQVTGQGGVPVTAVKSVVLNVTVTEPTAPSWLAVWPAGQSRPLASNLNYLAGETVANLVVVDVGADGKVDLHNAAGSTHVIVDVAGWFTA